MVSPRSRRSRPSVDHIEESNSTASLFLGGARRAWMPGASLPGPDCPQIRDAQPVLAVAEVPLADSRPRNTSLSNPGPQEAALVSPVTPGVTLTSGPTLQPSASLANKPDTPTALPSPVPSTNSHPSHVVAHNRPCDVDFPAPDGPPVAVPPNRQSGQSGPSGQNAVPPSQPATVPHQDMLITTATPPCEQNADPRLPLPPLTSGLPVQSPVTEQTPGQSPSIPTVGQGNAPENALPRPQPSQPGSQPSGLTIAGDKTWAQWSASLAHLKKEPRGCPSPLTGPRFDLLEDACKYKDILYLVLHQVYCRQSLDNRSPSEFPELSEKICQEGMVRLQELIEPNTNMSEPMVRKFARFPQNFEDLKHQAWYRSTIQAICLCLSRMATHFADLKTRLDEVAYRRGYPLMVSELRSFLNTTSPVLMTVIFVSTCRHLYDPDTVEMLIPLFRQDLHASLQGRESTVMQAYKKILLRPRSVPLTVPISQPTFSAPSSSMSPDVPNRVAGLPRSGTQSAVGSPVGSIHSNPQSGQNSPRVWYPGRWVQYNPMQIQHPPQSQGQPGYYGPMRTAHQGLVQSSPQAQMQQPAQASVPSNSPSLTSHSSQSSPQPPPPAHSPWNGQMPTQPYQQLPPGPPGNDPRQGSSTQSPRTHLGGQRTIPPQQVSSSATGNPQNPSSRSQLSVPFFPSLDYRLPHVVHPNPTHMALHQADLRDPIKKLGEFRPNGEWVELELFQHLGGFVLPPQLIDPKELRYDLQFSLSETECQRLPCLQERSDGRRSIQTIQPGCNVIRLRCNAFPPPEQENLGRFWPTKNGVWPSVLYIFVNGTEMYVRRRAHNGKDIPLDISKHLRPGNNTIMIHFLLGPDECKGFKYAVAIEAMEVGKFEQVRDLVGIRSAEETRMSIQKRLVPSADSDDLAIVTDSLKISLIDPFMAQIFKSPVRSEHCDHLECFDHETFIKTRKNDSGPAPMNDNWRCPICNADARPQLLRVDKYFTAVRDYLVATNELEGAQAIQVKADGTWTVQAVRENSPTATRSPRADRSSLPATGKRKAADAEAGSDATRTKHDGCSLASSPARRTASQSVEPVVIELD
ncbi:transcriptional regulator family: Zinc finger MIZ-type [Penicillium cinerascens]|uniref:Transcriptional regulator family: Zinc finger MIZ-type n=1 Tax=Penicillium cinerascens TaxID=70096 RepID=A0A9W9N322_9EURO|nr:transcriptional regulator family: Zinc finger MIZ-type [Penicillium cinerascens]KAJ5212264.1 transcriptional regulator family: Zinc finger MIZ-type [Penicillium cinerascens]